MIHGAATAEAMLALELFQLDPSSKKSAAFLNQTLVQAAMFRKPDARSITEIAAAVSELVDQAEMLSPQDCRQALSDSVQASQISQSGPDSYVLQESAVTAMAKAAERNRLAEAEFDRGLADTVSRSLDSVLDPFQQHNLFRTVKEVIQGIFHRGALKLRSMLAGQSDASILLATDSEAERELRERLQSFTSVTPNATVDATVGGIQLFMGRLNESQKHFVANLHRAVFYSQMLNIDPRLRDLEQKAFSNTRIYLDTNVMIRYLCETEPSHKATSDILATSQRLGVRLLVSTKTLQESTNLIEDAVAFHPHLDDSKYASTLMSGRGTLKNPIINCFVSKRHDNPRLNWAAFISPFKDLETYLLTKDIEVTDDGCGLPKDIEVTDAAISGLEDTAYSRVRTAMIETKGDTASPNIINHDAYNIVLVQKLRTKYPASILGSSVWLVTVDTRLPIVDRKLAALYPNPHCRMLEQWGTALLPFQNVREFLATDEYISYLVSTQLGAVVPENALDVHFIEELDKADVVLDDILGQDPEIAFRALADLQLDREAADMLAKIQIAPDEGKESLRSEFHSRATAAFAKRNQEDKARDQAEIERLQRGVQELGDKLLILESSIQKNSAEVESTRQQLESTKKSLAHYESMPFLERIRHLFGPKKPKGRNLVPSESPKQDQPTTEERVAHVYHTEIYGNVGNVAAGGQNVTQSAEMNIVQNDFESLRRYLSSLGIPDDDLTQLKTAIGDDSAADKRSRIGDHVSAWIAKMISKAAEGAFRIGTATAAGVLAQAICRYYGISQ